MYFKQFMVLEDSVKNLDENAEWICTKLLFILENKILTKGKAPSVVCMATDVATYLSALNLQECT